MNRFDFTSRDGTSCRYDLQDILDYMNGRLEKEPARLFGEHLAECDVCRTTLEELTAILPEDTRSLFREALDEAGGEAEEMVRSESGGFPFPELSSRPVSGTGLQKVMKKDRSGIRSALKRRLDELVNRTRQEISLILEGTQPVPVFSSVRGTDGPIRMDIVNLTGIPLDDDRLQPSVQDSRWMLDGFPAEFRNHDAYLMLLPISALIDLIPGWNRDESQDQLKTFFQDGSNALTLPGVSVTSARFVERRGGTTLVFDIAPETDRLLRVADQMTAAILII